MSTVRPTDHTSKSYCDCRGKKKCIGHRLGKDLMMMMMFILIMTTPGTPTTNPCTYTGFPTGFEQDSLASPSPCYFHSPFPPASNLDSATTSNIHFQLYSYPSIEVVNLPSTKDPYISGNLRECRRDKWGSDFVNSLPSSCAAVKPDRWNSPYNQKSHISLLVRSFES